MQCTFYSMWFESSGPQCNALLFLLFLFGLWFCFFPLCKGTFLYSHRTSINITTYPRTFDKITSVSNCDYRSFHPASGFLFPFAFHPSDANYIRYHTRTTAIKSIHKPILKETTLNSLRRRIRERNTLCSTKISCCRQTSPLRPDLSTGYLCTEQLMGMGRIAKLVQALCFCALLILSWVTSTSSFGMTSEIRRLLSNLCCKSPKLQPRTSLVLAVLFVTLFFPPFTISIFPVSFLGGKK